MRTLSVEEQTVLLLSWPDLTEDDLDSEISRINRLDAPIDCNKLLEIAVRNNVAPLLYKNSRGANIFPARFENHLQLFYNHALSANRAKSKELIKIIDLLRAEGIAAIPLKGAFASETIFGDPGVYPSGDKAFQPCQAMPDGAPDYLHA